MPSRAQIGQPVPGEDVFDTDNEVLSVGGNGLAKRFWAGWPMPVYQDFAIVVYEAEVHGAGMQINAPVKLLLFRVESHEKGSPSS